MKKILLINNENDIKEYLTSKIFYEKIIVLTYETAIICFQKNIKFIYIKDIFLKKNLSVSKLYFESYKLAKKIDKKITSNNHTLKNYNFFTNYFNFTRGGAFIQTYHDYIKFLTKKFSKYKINYFRYNSYNYFDFFTECIRIHKKKRNISEIKIFKNNHNNNYFKVIDDPEIHSFKKLIFKFKNLNILNRESILCYLVSKDYLDLLKKYASKNKINILFYSTKFTNINFIKKMNISCPSLIKTYNNKNLKIIFLQKYLEYLFPYLINQVLNTHKQIDMIFKKQKIRGYITQHNTLKSNTIKQYLDLNNIKTLNLLHGGTFGHFINGFFWPTLNSANLKLKNISHYQNYSNIHKKISILQNLKFKIPNKKNTTHIFPSENFLKLKNKYNENVKKKNITYITQTNNNVIFRKLQNINDSYKLYLARNKFIKKIFMLEKYNLQISYTEKSINLCISNEIMKLSKKSNKISFSNYNAIKFLKKSDVVILEQPSTTLIEALYLNIPIIIVLKNPLLKLEKSQVALLKKRIYYVDNLDMAFKILTKNHIFKSNNDFIKKFYPSNIKNKFYSIVEDLFGN